MPKVANYFTMVHKKNSILLNLALFSTFKQFSTIRCI